MSAITSWAITPVGGEWVKAYPPPTPSTFWNYEVSDIFPLNLWIRWGYSQNIDSVGLSDLKEEHKENTPSIIQCQAESMWKANILSAGTKWPVFVDPARQRTKNRAAEATLKGKATEV